MPQMINRIWLLALLCLCIAAPAASQSRDKYYFGDGFRFQFINTDSRMQTRGPVTLNVRGGSISRALDYKKIQVPGRLMSPVSPIVLGVKLNPQLSDFHGAEVMVMSKTYNSFVIADTSSAILIAMGINKRNVHDYQYRVIENDSIELVPWSPIRLAQNYEAEEPYGFIGKFNAPGKQLLVEVKKISDYNIREGVVFDWRTDYKPVVTQLTVHLADNGTNRIYYFNINYPKMNKGYASRFDKATGMPLDFKFPVDSISNLRLSFKSHLTVAYSVYITKNIGGKIDTSTVDIYLLNNFLGNFIDVDSRFFNKPGKYEIIIHRNAELGYWGKDQTLRIPFTVQPPPALEQKASLKQLLPYIIAGLVVIAILFWLYRRQANVRLAQSVQARQNTALKLRSIRAQLNPHFMFNALTSIQNLVNKNDMEGANLYLSRFANLTRKVLNTGEHDQISLEEEVKILDDYLLMEQLRFNFNYVIDVNNAVNTANIDVPAMLLQPFVENAVKHGVANLRENGVIKVMINRNANDLIFSISDNGAGFKQNHELKSPGSFGLKLSQERVVLLNEVYKDQPAKLDINSGADGTTVTITLSNWIS